MVRFGIWSKDVQEAFLPQPQAQIDIIEGDRKMHLVKAANSKIQVLLHHHHRRGYRADILNRMQSIEVSFFLPHVVLVTVSR